MTPDEIDAALFRARVPAIAMLRTPQATDPGTPGCWFGGEPTLPAEIPWPYYKPNEREARVIIYEDPELAIPMHFLVQINLAYCPRVLGLPLLPKTGTIFVFYDPAVAQTTDWIAFTTGTGCKVIYVAEDVHACPPRPAPPMPDLSSAEVSDDYQGTSSFTRWTFDFVVADTYLREGFGPLIVSAPDLFSTRWDELDRQREKGLEEHLGADIADRRARVVGGFHWMFGASQQERLPTVEVLKRSTKGYLPALTADHILLFRFVGDQDIGHQTINQIFLEFWITREDLANQIFDNVVVWEN
ncbi:MAG: DUF1963 domain-containing protein [Pseudomonadota bacterium]